MSVIVALTIVAWVIWELFFRNDGGGGRLRDMKNEILELNRERTNS